VRYWRFRIAWAERIGVFVISLVILAVLDIAYNVNPWIAGVLAAGLWTYLTEGR
jgi:hypothetical protein